jgi:hypothetical protein
MMKIEESSGPNPSHQEIAERARAIYEKSGRIPGRDVQNWLQAEAELRRARKQVSSKTAKPVVTRQSQSPSYA